MRFLSLTVSNYRIHREQTVEFYRDRTIQHNAAGLGDGGE